MENFWTCLNLEFFGIINSHVSFLSFITKRGRKPLEISSEPLPTNKHDRKELFTMCVKIEPLQTRACRSWDDGKKGTVGVGRLLPPSEDSMKQSEIQGMCLCVELHVLEVIRIHSWTEPSIPRAILNSAMWLRRAAHGNQCSKWQPGSPRVVSSCLNSVQFLKGIALVYCSL